MYSKEALQYSAFHTDSRGKECEGFFFFLKKNKAVGEKSLKQYVTFNE